MLLLLLIFQNQTIFGLINKVLPNKFRFSIKKTCSNSVKSKYKCFCNLCGIFLYQKLFLRFLNILILSKLIIWFYDKTSKAY